jgi:bone morphogenetic protein receptor type-2
LQSKRKDHPLNVDKVQQSFTSPVHKSKHLNLSDEKISNNRIIAQRPKNLDIVSPIMAMRNENISQQNYKTPFNDPYSDPFAIVSASKIVTSKSATLNSSADNGNHESHQLKRQRSLEVFREVFAPSMTNLRDVQCRVKTPGDLPASVRKVRASKTLSLYDDRIMDPNFKLIGDDNSL